MPHEIRVSLRLTLRLEDLDVGVIAGADIASKLIIADAKKVAAEHGFTIETDGPKIVQVRAKGEAEPQATTLDLPSGVTGPSAGDALPQNATVAGDLTDAEKKELEIPDHLKRKAKP